MHRAQAGALESKSDFQPFPGEGGDFCFVSRAGDFTTIDNLSVENEDVIGLVILGTAGGAMREKLGKRFTVVRQSLQKVVGTNSKVAPVVNYGPFAMKPFFADLSIKKQCDSGRCVNVYEAALPLLQSGETPDELKIEVAYKVLLNLLLYAMGDAITKLSLSISGPGLHHWSPSTLAALVALVSDDLGGFLITWGERLTPSSLPTLYIQGEDANNVIFERTEKEYIKLRAQYKTLPRVDQNPALSQAPALDQFRQRLRTCCTQMVKQYEANFLWDQVVVNLPRVRADKLELTSCRVIVSNEKANQRAEIILKNVSAFSRQPLADCMKMAARCYRSSPLGNFFMFRWNHTGKNIKTAEALISFKGVGAACVKRAGEALLELINDPSRNPVGDWRLWLAALFRAIERKAPHLLNRNGKTEAEKLDTPINPAARIDNRGGGGSPL